MLAFHGTGLPAENFFAARRDGAWGTLHQAEAVKALLDRGVAVISPQARKHIDGKLYWDTNGLMLTCGLCLQTPR